MAVDTDDNSQEQSSESIESNDDIATETTSSDTTDNTIVQSEVETQPTSNENQATLEVQRHSS